MRHFGEKIIGPLTFSQAFNRESARKIKSKVNIPVFAVGGMADPAVMEEVIEQGDADYISLSRALINNPNFPKIIQEGSREPSKCVHCNLCLVHSVSDPLRCYHGVNKNKPLG
jgi:2,4-dienoyl-CoA reductase-like NADH-dependent reductase (Old Yellow Enzyme family)